MNLDYVNKQLCNVCEVTSSQYEHLNIYLDELLRWNRKVNLTSIVDKDACWEKHIIDSMHCGCFVDGRERVLDIGSGAGLPSIPLSIIYENLQVLSVDSVTKKINFQRHVARLLDLKNYETTAARIESLVVQEGGRFDVVVSRAFASLELFVKLALPFMKPHGRIIAMKSVAVDNELSIAENFLCTNNLHIAQKREVKLQPTGSKRVLLEIKYN